MANLVRIEDIIEVVGMSNYIKSLDLPMYQLKYTGYMIDTSNQAVLNFKYVNYKDSIILLKVSISKDRKLTFFHCGCDMFNDKEYCPHIALVIQFLFEQKELINEIIGSLAMKKDVSFNRYLFKTLDTKKEDKVKINFDIILKKESYYYYDDGIYSLQLKIGEHQKYQLNSRLYTFLQSYQDDDFVMEFGKNFTYDSKKYYIAEEEQPIIDFLNIYYSRYTSYDRNYRGQILLSDKLLKQFLLLLLNHDFELQIGLNQHYYSNIRTDLNLNTELKDTDDGIELVLQDLSLEPIVDDYSFLKYQKEIYYLDADSAKLLKVLLDNNRKSVIFDKDEYEQFNNLIFPVLKRMDKGLQVSKKINNLFVDTVLTPKFYIETKDDKICCRIMLSYLDQEINIYSNDNKIGDVFIIRNKSLEKQYRQDLMDYGFLNDNKNQEFLLSDIDQIVLFLQQGLNDLCAKYSVFVSKEVRNKKILKDAQVRSSFELGKENILSYQFEIDHISKEELSDFMKSVKEKKKYYQLKNGDIVSIKDSELDVFAKLVDEFSLEKEELEKGKAMIRTYELASVEHLINDDFVSMGLPVRELLDRFHHYKNQEISFSVEGNKVLRDYQKDGVRFMKMLSDCGFGGILADEMGLGKSLQTIEYIRMQLTENPTSKFLIVVPTSLIYNWENELKKFAPNISYIVVNDKKEYRIKQLEQLDDINVIITSYGLLRQDINIYTSLQFNTCIIDEAQAIKNMSSQNAKAVKQIVANTKIALTGTPIENSVLELWSIFDYIMPGFLKSSKSFKEKYNLKKIEEDSEIFTDLRKQISPFILRRKKIDVLKDLPDKIENTIYVDLSEDQKKLYLAWLEKTKEKIDQVVKEEGYEKSQILILSLLTKLRQICIEPRLIMDDYDGGNAKLDALIDILKQVIENDHKVLLFSQFPSALQFVKKELEKEHITYYYLDGSTKSKTRMDMVNRFNHDQTNVFLISLKAGGTGLNLTSADVVIHLDPWWNPQVENQATDRTHRIGQKNIVEVMKFITKGTIEEKILTLQEKKKKLSEQVIEGSERSKLVLSKLDEHELRELLEL